MSIQLNNVSKQFGTSSPSTMSPSLSRKLLGLLGPSGGGKTTVLRMIAGLELPTSGDILVRGKRVNDIAVQQRNIGFVFQNYALFQNHERVQERRVRVEDQEVEEGRYQKPRRGIARTAWALRTGEALSASTLRRQRQRVAIARALAPQPSVLLLDEPFGAVDAKIRQELREWLVRLHSDLNVTTCS